MCFKIQPMLLVQQLFLLSLSLSIVVTLKVQMFPVLDLHKSVDATPQHTQNTPPQSSTSTGL